MVELGGGLVAPSAIPGDGRWPCPYCGTWNEADFAFCKKCGRQAPTPTSPSPAGALSLPPPPTAAFASRPAVAAAASAPGGPIEDSPVAERPLTPAEQDSLKRAAKNGAAGGTRFFGAFVGLVPLVMIGMAMTGTPFVPDNYIAIVMVSGFLGVILAGISQSLRGPLARAAREGTAHEVYGVPEIRAAPGNWSLVSLGGLTFRMRASTAAAFLPNRMNRVTFADGGPIAGGKRALGTTAAFVLEANGTAMTRPHPCYIVDASAADANADVALGMKKVGGR